MHQNYTNYLNEFIKIFHMYVDYMPVINIHKYMYNMLIYIYNIYICLEFTRVHVISYKSQSKRKRYNVFVILLLVHCVCLYIHILK